ncbi:hypothetical protein [Enterobacter cloacae complex sp. 288G10]|uniref:hypothetical protein n=1 Tax=Enterobacter cloacae complex sp. 288G10 TaxID=3395859 RepID=UPI003CEF9E80
MPTKSMYSFQVIRPASGSEIPQLNLPAGDYSVVRYVFIPFKGNGFSINFSGIIFRSDSPKFTTPGGVAASINGKDYYLSQENMVRRVSLKKLLKQNKNKGALQPLHLVFW